MQLNDNIKLIRELSGKTQPVFAKLIGTKLSNLKTYETTDVKPKANILASIADFAGISVTDLIQSELTHKDIRIKSKNDKIVKKDVSHETLVEEPETEYQKAVNYKEKYISLLEKENERVHRILDISLNELILGNRIAQAHMKALLQITVIETARMQQKDADTELMKANKVVADNFAATEQTGS